ncbi:polysaccharide deacetylase family protein [Paenibacillus harenae]|uniref:Peptidoglycan/xylan/chitin deacetylase (PgdA/CDA1 family) n=1 Tax=Paenibacillus harenae TaxID=306543 RepID=A0ABT9TTV6_PAEHA|nr:polysaccharide deacetylase family protein [Paenibacillus harenae]MDQ0110781.1 peptidoglycan/xylan/chitin deacetylase (PgdA/CDA1 family) [Paenibacillus harenae]
MVNLFLWILYLATLYAFLPGLISRTFGYRVFKRGRVDKEIALTFDDGPDSVYTPLLLDLLARHKAKATFFVVGSHALGQEDILVRMKAEGHVIGIHNYVHKSNWLMRPRAVQRQIEATNDIIEKATGKRSIYYRPPWGIVNVFDFAKAGYLHIILWSAMFSDWKRSVGSEKLKKRMMKRLKPGEVLLLHDCGRTFGADPEAPENMLIALESYLEEGSKLGYRFVGIDEMIKLTETARVLHTSIWKKSLISLWLMWEKAYHVMFRLKQVGESAPTFYYRVTKYNGEPIDLEEGSRVVKGDHVAELHLDNKMLSGIAMQAKTPLAAGIKMLREIEHALPQLADQLAEDSEAKDIKAVYGVTMIHRGADRLGFEIFHLPEGWFARSTRVYLKILMSVLTNKPRTLKKKQSQNREAFSPRMLLMPASTIRRYATSKLTMLQEDTERLSNAVERTIGAATDDAAQLGTKTTAI